MSVARKRAACSRTPTNKRKSKEHFETKISSDFFHILLYLAYKSHKLRLELDLWHLVRLIILECQVESV